MCICVICLCVIILGELSGVANVMSVCVCVWFLCGSVRRGGGVSQIDEGVCFCGSTR